MTQTAEQTEQQGEDLKQEITKPEILGRDGLKNLTKHITEHELPAFAQTARVVAGEAANNESSVSDLSQAILVDPSMTVRLLKMANSIYYNPMGNPINTVSRAIIMLGFSAVKNISMSISIIDSLLEGRHKHRILHELGQSYHAAVQARNLAIKRNDRLPEEVFIAALLMPLGRMAYWCFADKLDPDIARQLDQALKKPGANIEKVERRLLGYPLTHLTAELNKEWHLSSLLENSFNSHQRDDSRIRCVRYGYEIARTAEQGWESEDMSILVKRVAKMLGQPVEDICELMETNAKDAALGLVDLGIKNTLELVPVPERLSDQVPSTKPLQAEQAKSAFLEPDIQLQEKILHDIDQVISDKPDLNTLIELVLEGILRGCGMDRTVFALLTPDKKQLRAKWSLGWDKNKLNSDFNFQMGTISKHVMDHIVEKNTKLWYQPGSKLERLITPPIRRVTGDREFYIGPVQIHQKIIGILYADRRPSKRDLDLDTFEQFWTFCQRASAGIGSISSGSNK